MKLIKAHKLPLIVLFVLSVSLYVNTLNHGYVLDDFSVIKENYIVKKGVEAIPEIFKTHYRQGYGYVQGNLFRPLTLSLFALQWELAPDSPAFAHFFNILLYAIALVLLYLYLLHLFKNQYLVFLSCLLFAAHPIHTEVVANIKSVDEILAFCFFLSSMLVLFQFHKNKKKTWFFLSLLLFFLGFLCKESMLSYIGIIPLSLVFFKEFSLKKAIGQSLWYLIPFFVYLSLRVKALGTISGDKTVASIDNMLMAAPNEAVRLATAIKIMGLYLWKLVFPHPLVNDYSLKEIAFVSFASWETWLSLAIYAFLIYHLFKWWKNRAILNFGIGFFLVSIVLYSNIFLTIGTSFGERLLFVPSLGFCIVLAYLLIQLLNEKPLENINWTGKAFILVAGITLIYGFKTIDRNQAWENNFSLYATDVENCPNSARCQYYYGLGLMKEKAILLPEGEERKALLNQAIAAFTKSLEILPTYSDAWGQRGLAYYRLKQPQAALFDYNKSVEYNPQNSTSWSNMGAVYFESKQYKEALNAYEKAIQSNPNNVDALANYGATLGSMGDFNSSITYFKRAYAIQSNPEYLRLIALSYQNMGNKAQADLYLNQYNQLKAQ